MITGIEIIPVIPFAEGAAAGTAAGAACVRARIDALCRGPYLRDTLGALTREELDRRVTARLETPPDVTTYPELQEVYPERVEWLRGFAAGAACTRTEAAVYDYLTYRTYIEGQYRMYQLQPPPGHCSGALLVGPDGVLAGQNIDTAPPPKPADYRHRAPRAYRGLRQRKAVGARPVLRRPPTGYIEA
ncbi:MAG TPA: hypothetical protein PK794_13590, partial [Armatimonadota bacterium]|nr:hypothetical protein [Armatimonadota bacterium]